MENFFKNRQINEKFEKQISAGFIIFRKTEKGLRFLILYHGNNYWNFPKGKIETEEKSLTTAFRETKEETGLTRDDLQVIPDFKVYEKYSFKSGQKIIRKIVIFYLAETKKATIKISDEHEGYAWFSYSMAMKMLRRYKGNQRILKIAYNFLRQKMN